MGNSKQAASRFYVESELADWSPEERQRRVSCAFRVILNRSGPEKQRGQQGQQQRANVGGSEITRTEAVDREPSLDL